MPASTMTALRTGRHERPAAGTPGSLDDPRCGVCPHPVADHDAIALRFCRATMAPAIDRGCACQVA